MRRRTWIRKSVCVSCFYRNSSIRFILCFFFLFFFLSSPFSLFSAVSVIPWMARFRANKSLYTNTSFNRFLFVPFEIHTKLAGVDLFKAIILAVYSVICCLFLFFRFGFSSPTKQLCDSERI